MPYPADYGGVIDIFYKIKTLHQCGIKIHLHCYEYGRGVQPELENYCTEVKYYHRQKGHKGFSHKLPYIVCSRYNKEMLEDLIKDDHPILVEGIHCTYLLNDERFKKRKIIVRLHNVEYEYYRQLFYSEKSLLKKIYYWHESSLLRKYEKKISGKTFLLAMSERDVKRYQDEFSPVAIAYLPVFLPYADVQSKPGTGCFCLYHGNLSVSENEKAVTWLLKQVFNTLSIPFLIAGKNPSMRLKRLVYQHPHACLVVNPSEQEMQDIIGKAQINILPSLNCTGIKFKLLNALFNGKHCVVNEEPVKNTGLESACHIGSDSEGLKKIIEELYDQPFTEEEIKLRQELLSHYFDNEKNGRRLIQWIW